MEALSYYFTQVLGLKEIVLPSGPTAKLTVVLDGALSSEEETLLSKMLQAIGLSFSDVVFSDVKSWNGASLASSGAAIVFVDEPHRYAGRWSEPVVITYGPRRLLREPALKKVTWESLKKMLALLT